MTALEVGADDGPVFLLSGSVPDVEFGRFIGELYVLDFEVDSGDLGILLCEEVSLGEAPEEGSFADVAVTHDYYLVTLFVFIC